MMATSAAVILAAGEGKRMKSALPKVLHPCCGRPLIEYILESAAVLTTEIIVVVGHGASLVQEKLGDRWRYVLQEEQLGTGHAVMQAMPELPDEGKLLVLCGDTPLIDASILKNLSEAGSQAVAALATANVPDPTGYGRIVRDKHDLVDRIIEEKDADAAARKISEINCGTYCFDLKHLRRYLPLLSNNNAQQEYYLTDLITLMRGDGLPVNAYLIEDYRKGLGINDRAQLAAASKIIREEINHKLMYEGVTIEDPDNTWIDSGVSIAKDTVIRPFCVIESGTIIGASCIIGPSVHLRQAVIKDQVTLSHVLVDHRTVDRITAMKPFSHFKPGQ